jgi:hypothetical protein
MPQESTTKLPSTTHSKVSVRSRGRHTDNHGLIGTGIAIHTVPSPLGGLYSISIDDDQEQQLDSYDPSVSIDSPVCSAPFSQQNLNPGLPHTVEIWVLGASPLAPPGAPIGQLDFDAFVYVHFSFLPQAFRVY